MAGDTGDDSRSTYIRHLIDPPPAIVQDGAFVLGCYTGPSPLANMLDVERPFHYKVPRWVKAFRCKEWRAFQFGNQRWFFFTALYEAKSFGISAFIAWDRERNKSWEFKHLLPFRSYGIGEHLDGEVIGYHNRQTALAYRTDLSGGEIRVDASKAGRRGVHGRTGGFTGAFMFAWNARQTAPSTVCLPLGLNRAMYSTKVLMPMQGWFEVDGQRHEFDGTDSMGIMDDHKGYYPYRLRYDWVTGFGLDARGRRVGFNLTDNQVRDQETYNENVMWINSRVFPLPPVRVTRPNGPGGLWHIQDTEGLVDLAFKPQRKNDIRLNALVVRTNYHGPFGTFEGLIKAPGGNEKIDASGLCGMGEQKYLRA